MKVKVLSRIFKVSGEKIDQYGYFVDVNKKACNYKKIDVS